MLRDQAKWGSHAINPDDDKLLHSAQKTFSSPMITDEEVRVLLVREEGLRI